MTENLNIRNYSQNSLLKTTKAIRFGWALSSLTQFNEYADEVLSETSKETNSGYHTFIPESKQQSIEWRHISSTAKIKAKQTLSRRKIMATVFGNRRGILLAELMSQGQNTNTKVYCGTLNQLRRAIQNKRRVTFTKGFSTITPDQVTVLPREHVSPLDLLGNIEFLYSSRNLIEDIN